MDIWQFLEEEPKWGSETKALYEWSMNHTYFEPFKKFLDLIGYSEEEYGQPSGDWKEPSKHLGYMELGYLADALQEYVNNPQEVTEYIHRLLDAEVGVPSGK